MIGINFHDFLDELSQWSRDNPDLQIGMRVTIYSEPMQMGKNLGDGTILDMEWDSFEGIYYATVKTVVGPIVEIAVCYLRRIVKPFLMVVV